MRTARSACSPRSPIRACERLPDVQARRPRGAALAAALFAMTVAAAMSMAVVHADAIATDVTAVPWSYTLPREAVTSAGVFAADGSLLRTLWRGEARTAGAHDETWDGRDDTGQPAAVVAHEIRLLHHHVRYVWEGVVGNSSESFDGTRAHKAYLPPVSLVLRGNEVIYTAGYNEHQPGLHMFTLDAPQRVARPFASIDPFVAYGMLAADAERLYWADVGGMSPASFVGAYDIASRKPVAFTRGTSTCLNRRSPGGACYEAQRYEGVIDVQAAAADAPVGLAVQSAGRVLAVAHRGRIRLFDKRSGALLNEIELPMGAGQPNQLAMTPRGDLWAISGRTLVRWGGLPDAPRIEARIEGFEHPVAVGANPLDEGAWVADGAASSQLKRYSAAGTLQATIGRRGGYAGDPVVSDDKLCFRAREGDERTGIAAAADGSVWVVDTCNNRLLRYRAEATGAWRSDLAVAYLPAFYASTVDHANTNRVFANFLEFEIDDAAALQPGRGWKLVRNWLGSLPAGTAAPAAANFGFDGFLSVETLASGRTIAMVRGEGHRQSLVELPRNGPARLLKRFAAPRPGATGSVLYENGDLGHALSGPATQIVLRRPLTGFDATGDPLWADTPSELARVPRSPGSPYDRGAFSGMPPRFPLTGSGHVVFLDPSISGNEGFHLGAAASGSDRWLWQASPTGPFDGKGSFQTRAIDGSLQYGGNVAWANGRHVVYGYHGEFYRDLVTNRVGQANQFMHFDESGLFLGQFGEPSTRDPQLGQPGLSGNAFSPTLVRSGGRLYLYHNDESSHGGVHRWRIDGADDIGDLRGSAAAGAPVVLR